MQSSRWWGGIVVLGCLTGLITAPSAARAQAAEDLRNELQENRASLQKQIEELRERLARAREEAADQVREWWHRKQDEWRAESGKEEPLGRSVRLEFSFQPSELPAASVSVATTRYTFESRAEQAGQSFHIKVVGSVKPAEKPDSALLLTFDAAVELEKEEDDSVQTLHANGSVLAPVGKSAPLASIGRYTLTVLVQPGTTE